MRDSGDSVTKALRASIREGVGSGIHFTILGGAVQTAYLLYLGFNSAQIGIIAAIPQLAFLIQIAVAFGMQRWRNRRAWTLLFLSVARAIWVTVGLIPLLFPEKFWFIAYAVITLTTFLLGQAGAIVWTSMIADIVPHDIQGRFFGKRNAFVWSAVCFSLWISGLVLRGVPGLEGFALLFSICAICVVWSTWELIRHPNPPFLPSETGMSWRLFLQPFRDTRFRSALMFLFSYFFVYQASVPFFNYLMLDRYSLSYGAVANITILYNAAIMVSSYLWGVLSNRRSEYSLLYGSFVIMALSALIWAGVGRPSDLPVLIISHGLLGIGFGGYNLMIFRYLINGTPQRERPIYIAVFYSVTGLAGFLGPVLGGQLMQGSGNGPAWMPGGIVPVCGAVMLLITLSTAPAAFRKR
ncbi:MFS transporter [Cohnella caldifontis]|uniref:MFS transporter n=1 Tax=Cohnella caldifontis TaxID=3027471 RepID=UPI0023ED91DD|nr:MFS transporter [Cohnella sp. YIM B05605]